MKERGGNSRILIVGVVIAIVVVVAAGSRAFRSEGSSRELTFSQLIERVEEAPESIELITFKPRDRAIEAVFADGVNAEVNYPSEETQIEFQRSLEEQGILFDSDGIGGSILGSLLVFMLPFLLIVVILVFLFRRMGGGAQGMMGIGKSKAKRHTPDMPRVTFKDVAGADEAVEELFCSSGAEGHRCTLV